MRTVNYDIALTLGVTIPDNLAGQYRSLVFSAANKELAKLSSELTDDDDFVERILHDNIRHLLTKQLPQYLEAGGFGVTVIPLAQREAHEIENTGQGELPLETQEG